MDRGPHDFAPNHTSERDLKIILGLIERGRATDNRSGEDTSWKDWVLGIMAAMVVVGIPATIYQLTDLKSDTKVLIETQKVESARIDRLESHVYRGGP